MQTICRTQRGAFYLERISDTVIRCVYTKKECVEERSAIGIVRDASEKKAAQELYQEENGDITTLSAGKLAVQIDKKSGAFTWLETRNGKVLLRELEKELVETPGIVYTTGGEEPVIRRVKTVDGERNFVENLRAVECGKTYRAKLNFVFQEEEKIHGLGQAEEGFYNLRGHVQYLYQHNMRIPIPFFVSTKGYGVLVDCGSLMTWNDDERGSWLFCDAVQQLDYYVVAGDSLGELIYAFRQLTGRAAMLPKWAFGYIQSKEKYSSQEELIEVAKRYRELGVGLDCVVQDWKTWEADDWGCKILDKTRYPDIGQANRKLHDMHVHSMVSVWPNMNYGTRDYTEMSDAGYMLNDLATYNAFDEQARSLYWQQCSRELFQGGFDSWWCDSTEPFSGPDWSGEYMREPWERYHMVGQEHKKFLGSENANLYAVAHAKGIFENQRRQKPGKRVLNLTRSGYAGSQRYGTMLWSGDISARWDVLRKQIAEGLNMCMSGMPYWTLDIGGFFVLHRNWQKRGCECETDPDMKWFWHGDYEDGIEDMAYRELYVRWFEMGAFLPMFRAHGTDVPREIWNFGEPGDAFYDALVESIRLRYRLMPYIYTLAGRTMLCHDTMMRSLLFDFADDPIAADCTDEFMMGGCLLICPILEPMYYDVGNQKIEKDESERMRSCYLPGKDEGWYDFYTGEYFAGGQTISVGVTLCKIPVFVRAGSILPMEKSLSYAQERAETPMEFHIFPHRERLKKAQGYLYEDAGDDYGYEDGNYNGIGFYCDGNRNIFHMDGSQNVFEGGLRGRKCVVIQNKTVIADFVYDGSACDVDCRVL